MKPNIAFDVDGIAANFSAAFVPYAKKRYGINFKESNRFHWEVEPELSGPLFDKIIAWFIRDHSHKIRYMEDGVSLIDHVWKATKKPITFVTARHEMTCAATHHWMKSIFPGMDFIVITVDSGNDKIRFLDDFDCFVEDRRKTAVQLAENGKIVFMPKRHYNMPLPSTMSRLAESNIIILDSLTPVCYGNYDHLIFKP